MTASTSPEKTYNTCTNPHCHRDHMCHLMEKGMTAEVARLSSKPAFFCANCGARANKSRDLCNPLPCEQSA